MRIMKASSLGILVLLIGCNGIDAESLKIEPGAPSSNPYNLSTEEKFETTYMNEVEPYWKKGKQGEFTGVDGIKIKYMTFIKENEKGAIVISSGRTEGYFKYHELVYDLGKQGYSIYIHDHRGQGDSERIWKQNLQMGHVNKFDDYVKDLKIFVDQVVKQVPHSKLFLLAHSMGGGIATQYIETYPNDFTAAALSSPMHEPGSRLLFVNEGCEAVRSTNWIRENIRRINTPRYVLGTGNYESKDCSRSDLTHSEVRCKKTAELYEQFPDLKLGGPSTNWAAEACRASKKLRSRQEVSKIRIPVLVLQAQRDTAVAPQGQREFCENLNSSGHVRCEGETPQAINGAYHELFVEKDEYRIPALTKILDFFVKQEADR